MPNDHGPALAGDRARVTRPLTLFPASLGPPGPLGRFGPREGHDRNEKEPTDQVQALGPSTHVFWQSDVKVGRFGYESASNDLARSEHGPRCRITVFRGHLDKIVVKTDLGRAEYGTRLDLRRPPHLEAGAVAGDLPGFLERRPDGRAVFMGNRPAGEGVRQKRQRGEDCPVELDRPGREIDKRQVRGRCGILIQGGDDDSREDVMSLLAYLQARLLHRAGVERLDLEEHDRIHFVSLPLVTLWVEFQEDQRQLAGLVQKLTFFGSARNHIGLLLFGSHE